MKNRNEAYDIYLKDLIFVVLYQWKKLLVIAVVLAALLGGFQGISGFMALKDPERLEVITKQNQIQKERYDAEVESLQMQIDTFRDQIRSQQEYLDNSLLMHLQPYEYYQATAVIYVATDYQILPGMEYQNPNPILPILQAYESLLLSNNTLQTIADTIGTESMYLKELLSVSIAPDANKLQVTVKAADEAQAQHLQNLLLEQVEYHQANISTSVANHTYTIMDQATREVFSQALADQQRAENDRLSTLLANQVAAQTRQDELKAPSLQGERALDVLKKAIIFAVIGGVLAVFFGVVILWIRHISSAKVYSCRTLIDRTGIKILGTCAMDTPSNSIDKKLLQLEGRQLSDAQAQAELIAVKLQATSKDSKRLLLTGSVDPQNHHLLTQALHAAGMQIESAEDILSSADALLALERCDTVLLIEQCHVSRYADVNSRIDLIQDYNKQLLGCVLYGG